MTGYKIELDAMRWIPKGAELQCCVCEEFFVMGADFHLFGGWSCPPCTAEVLEGADSFLELPDDAESHA